MKGIMLRKCLILFSVWMMTSHVLAGIPTCIPIHMKMHENNVVLNATDAKKGQIYFFKNISAQSLWVDHPNERASASAGWSSYIRPGNWSALMLNRKNFDVSCAIIRPGQVEYLNCAKVLYICMPQKVVVTQLVKGTVWLSEDKPWEELWKAVAKRLTPKTVSE